MIDLNRYLIASQLQDLTRVQRPERLVARRGTTGEIFLYGMIGFPEYGGVSDTDLIAGLKDVGDVKELKIHINSPGGDFVTGLAMYANLARHPARKVCVIDGEASSAASVVAMSGDRVVMAPQATMMIHEVHVMGARGTAADLRKAADLAESSSTAMRDIYVKRTNLDPAVLAEMLAAETTMTAARAVELKFADEVEQLPERRTAMNIEEPMKKPLSNLSPLDIAMRRAGFGWK